MYLRTLRLQPTVEHSRVPVWTAAPSSRSCGPPTAVSRRVTPSRSFELAALASSRTCSSESSLAEISFFQLPAALAGGVNLPSSVSARRSIAPRRVAVLAVAASAPSLIGTAASSLLRRAQIASACVANPETAGAVDPLAVVPAPGASELAVDDARLGAVAVALCCWGEPLVAVAAGWLAVTDAAGLPPGSSPPPQPPSASTQTELPTKTSARARSNRGFIEDPSAAFILLSKTTAATIPGAYARVKARSRSVAPGDPGSSRLQLIHGRVVVAQRLGPCDEADDRPRFIPRASCHRLATLR